MYSVLSSYQWLLWSHRTDSHNYKTLSLARWFMKCANKVGRRPRDIWWGRHPVCIHISCLNLLAHSHRVISPPRGITGMGSPCGRRNTRWEHSPSSLEAPSRGCGGRCCPTARLSIGGAAVAQSRLWPAPDHRVHTCPSSVHARVHSYCTPAPRSLPTPPRLWQLIGGGGGGNSWSSMFWLFQDAKGFL